uniref:MADF domain-containing protein n=1 Tax=Heliothis virescens TaxID=7102 RepID=A0A2A4K3B5_HELVI
MSKNQKREQLIKIVQQYPIIYQPAPSDVSFIEHKNNLKIVWDEITLKLNPQVKTYRDQWARMYQTYAKLRMLIDSGTVSEKVLQACKDTNKFLDGSLSFLNPYISQETYLKIPFYVHRTINTRFGLPLEHGQIKNENIDCNINTATHHQVVSLLRYRTDRTESFDMNFLLPVLQKAIQRKLKELLMEKANNDETKKSTQTSDDIQLESELMIDENIKIESQEDIDALEENSSLDTDTMLEDDDLEQSLPHDQIVFGDSNISEDLTEHTAVSNNNEKIGTISDDYMRNFFNDLGETMSLELSIRKQKLLQLRINELLRNTLAQE